MIRRRRALRGLSGGGGHGGGGGHEGGGRFRGEGFVSGAPWYGPGYPQYYDNGPDVYIVTNDDDTLAKKAAILAAQLVAQTSPQTVTPAKKPLSDISSIFDLSSTTTVTYLGLAAAAGLLYYMYGRK